MSKSKHVTFGGLGQHEFYLPTTGKGHQNRRDRRKCAYYHAETRYCNKIHKPCVGPTLCKKYRQVNDKRVQAEHSAESLLKLYSEQSQDGNTFTVSGKVGKQLFSSNETASKTPEKHKKQKKLLKAED